MTKVLGYALTAMIGLAASDARAFGLGSSVGLEFGAADGGFAPSLDLMPGPAVIQLHVLRMVDAAASGALSVGANVYFDVGRPVIAGPIHGTVQPGFSVDLATDPDAVVVAAECRLGALAEEKAGFGVFVVPALGVAALEGDDPDVFGGGTLQVSVWFDL